MRGVSTLLDSKVAPAEQRLSTVHVVSFLARFGLRFIEDDSSANLTI
jgi:hypothetical protein